MPEQLLARIIRASSNPQDLVLDPFGGSGTTMCVAKKLGRQWMGFELSDEYAKYINQRLNATNVGDTIDGPNDPIESAPSTAKGKQQKNSFGADTEIAVIESYQKAGLGYPADYILCDKSLNEAFIEECLKRGIGGNAYVWNRYLLHLRKVKKLPTSTRRPTQITSEQMDRFGFASEVAWRLLAIDYRKTLDDILCSPEFAVEFDRLASLFGPVDSDVSSLEFRKAALSIRKRSSDARTSAAKNFSEWMRKGKKLPEIRIEDGLEQLEIPGVFVLCAGDVGFYAGESKNIRARVEQAMRNERWQSLEPNSVKFVRQDVSLKTKYALKSALVQREGTLLNCRLLIDKSELPNG